MSTTPLFFYDFWFFLSLRYWLYTVVNRLNSWQCCVLLVLRGSLEEKNHDSAIHRVGENWLPDSSDYFFITVFSSYFFFLFFVFERGQDFNRLRAIKTRNISNSIFSFWMYSTSVWRVSTIWYKCFSCFVYKYFQYPTLHHCALVAVPEYTHYLSLYVYRVIHGGM